jgi:drug/metabolite transporter (DMT)-like permease
MHPRTRDSTLGRPPAWLIWAMVAQVSWGVWAILSKLLGNALTAEQSQAFSTLGLLPILGPLVWSGGLDLRSASRKGIALAILGGVITCLGNIAYYAAVSGGEKVATVASVTAIAPLVTVLLAVLLLRESINRIQILGIALSLVAIWLFNVQTEQGLLSRALLFAVPPILLWGASGFLQKVATNHLDGRMAAIGYLGAFVPVGAVYALRAPWPNEIMAGTWILVVSLGFFISFGNFAVLAAYAHGGQAVVISPLTNLYPLISVPLAVLFLREQLSPREFAAIGTSLASIAALSRETRSDGSRTTQTSRSEIGP